MRNYEAILKNLQDPQQTDFQVFNKAGGELNPDPEEAAATIRAIGEYKQNTEFAEAIRRLEYGKQ